MSDLHVDSSFHKQSIKINNYHKITEWIDSSIGQSTVIEKLDKKDVHYPIQIKRKIEEDMLILKTAHISFTYTKTFASKIFINLFRLGLSPVSQQSISM